MTYARWGLCVVLLFAACAPPPPDKACKGLLAGDLVISEFMKDPEGADTGKEYVEIFNATGNAVDLAGLTVYVSRADGSSQKSHVMRSGTVPSKGYFVLGDAREQPFPPHVQYSYGDDLTLTNTDGLIGLKCGTSVIDELKYSDQGKPGRARTLDGKFVPDSVVNDQEASWCDAPNEFEPGAFGSPGRANDACAGQTQSGTCFDPLTSLSRPIAPPAPGDLVISEFMADPAAVADTDGEWLELYARADVDLNGVELASASGRTVLQSSGCMRVLAGSYSVFARSADAGANGGIDGVKGTITFSLTNSAGSLSVRLGDAGIDTVTYTSTDLGVATQLDVNKLDATANDDPASFCGATRTYGLGDKGSPGRVNETCQPPVTGDRCVDPVSQQPRAIVPPSAGDLLITEVMADPAAVSDAVGEYFEVLVKADVDLNGLVVSNDTGATPVGGQTCVRPGAGAYVLFAKNADPNVNGGLPAQKIAGGFSFALVQGGGTLTVRLGDGGVLDRMTYPAATAGASLQLSASALDGGSDGGIWCLTPTNRRITLPDGGMGDRGTPAQENEVCP